MSNVAKKGGFVYPWTLMERGADSSVRAMKYELGLNDLYVSVNYHSGRLFQPLSPGNKVKMRHRSTWSFQPDRILYPPEIPWQIDEEAADKQVQEQIREACLRHEVGYHAWVIGTHNSTIGRVHPDWCVHNVFGDIYDYALCPSHPAVRAYMKGLIADVCANLKPQSVLVESFGFLGFVHGHHHEKILQNLGPVCEYLWSLCFCSHCRRNARDHGLDDVLLQSRVREMAERMTEQERGAAGTDFTQAEMACLFLEEKELSDYARMRNEVVATLVAELKATTSDAGIKLYAMPSIVSSSSWMEGMALKRLSAIVDGWVILTYFAEPKRIRADIEWLRMFAGNKPCLAGLSAGTPVTDSAPGLSAAVQAAMSANAEGVIYYNLSMLTQTRLNWIAETNFRLS